MRCKHCGGPLFSTDAKGQKICNPCDNYLRDAGAELLLWIVREADPYTSKEDWTDPESFGIEVVKRARAAVEALRIH